MTKTKKGMVNLVYAGGIFIMFAMSIIFIFVSSLGTDPEKAQISINNVVYLMRDSLDIAKLYLENSARYSVYQAMYDNGKIGGFDRLESGKSFQYDGTEYMLWYDNSDISPDEDGIMNALETSAYRNFKNYTQHNGILAIYTVKMPGYSGINITNINNYSLRLDTPGDSDLSLSMKTLVGEDVTVEKSSDINLTLHASYYMLYQYAMEHHRDLKGRLADCNKNEIEKTEDKGCCALDVKVLDADDGGCLVKVELATDKTFLVWNGTETVIEPIKLVFLERATKAAESGE